MGLNHLTMKEWENSKMDEKADKAAKGKYGKEGSKREQAHDRAELAKYNKKMDAKADSLRDISKMPRKLKK